MTLKSIDAKRRAVENINQHKRHILHELRELEFTPGCAGAARELDQIVFRLEAWQSKHRQK